MKGDLAREMYRSWRDGARKVRRDNTQEPIRKKVGDPQPLNSVIAELVTTREWKKGIAEGTIFSEWGSVVGEEVASHATPLSLVDGLLTIQASSSAWATQLTLMATNLLKTVRDSAPGALVEEIVVLPPGAPSWKKGLRSIRNARGPRDTYG